MAVFAQFLVPRCSVSHCGKLHANTPSTLWPQSSQFAKLGDYRLVLMMHQESTPHFCERMFARTSYSEAVWGWKALLTPPSKMSSHS